MSDRDDAQGLHWVPSNRDPAGQPGRARWHWFSVLCLTLLGYALFGKGWAYLGVPPIFVGEVALLGGLMSLVRSGCGLAIFDAIPVWLLLALMALGSARTLPYVSTHGIDALRDAAVWGYAAFALIIYGCLLADPTRLHFLVRRYRRFGRIFLLVIPVIWVLRRFFSESIPSWPCANVAVVDAKGGDIFVHLAGILAFWVAGFEARVDGFRLYLMAFCVALVGTFDRAGLLSFSFVFAVCLVHRPHDRALWRLMLAGVSGLLLLAIVDFRVEMPGREREISAEQIVNNVASIFGHSDSGDLHDTKRWRLEWWNVIVDYTISGDYFWTGKGFGVNLADDDGFQCNEDGSVRSPHNVHMTFLARMGVPGLVLWTLVQLTWALGIARAYIQSREALDDRWSGLFLVLGAYWVASMINASFDVFLEGPMGGIWFWTIYGTGLAAMRLYRERPGLLSLSWRNWERREIGTALPAARVSLTCSYSGGSLR
jgi:hypothetical protein